MILKQTAAALALSLGLVASASAVVPVSYTHVTDLGSFSTPNTYLKSMTEGVGTFVDKLAFHVGSNTFIGGSVSNLAIKYPFNLFNIDGLSVQLYNGDTSDLIANLDLNVGLGSTANQKVGSALFAPGNYFLTIKGNATGAVGGMYVFAATTLPVPEPESYAMLLAGLGLMGTIARRRSKSTAA